MIIEKDCDNKKKGLKKIVIVEKDCDKKEEIKNDSHKRERFSQMIINKKKFKKILIKGKDTKDSHKRERFKRFS